MAARQVPAFARYRERPILEEKKFIGSEIASLPFGEQVMPALRDYEPF